MGNSGLRIAVPLNFAYAGLRSNLRAITFRCNPILLTTRLNGRGVAAACANVDILVPRGDILRGSAMALGRKLAIGAMERGPSSRFAGISKLAFGFATNRGRLAFDPCCLFCGRHCNVCFGLMTRGWRW